LRGLSRMLEKPGRTDIVRDPSPDSPDPQETGAFRAV